MTLWADIQHKALSDMPSLEVVIWDAIRIAVFFILARILIRIGVRVTRRMLSLHTKMDDRRRKTLESLFTNVIRYTVYFVLVVEVLSLFHVNVSAILASAGIVGVAVGFGAQSLVKDLISGLFILFEDQYGVGDTVQINGFKGTVISIGIRLTRVQAWTGEVQVIPNGQITSVTNYSRTQSTAVIDVTVPYDVDVDLVKSIMERVLTRLKDERPGVVTGPVQVLGVQDLSNTNLVIRATAVCAPTKNGEIEREAHERIKAELDRALHEGEEAQGAAGGELAVE
ncbi:mechanosensitive ion channel family protein [Alicyclobacillus mali]|uniref:Mechanosensitive ion channel family protein n=1 Tax=Alicyclobacillus mali (ex Roth et al. 2021) TaxID=1123961 RepID=A0ABS0F061_9BACL|nr:mechanosensitive ion channel family protein [Alicyclobacillus mali (ex Roth et al. 2021)]MBF8376673.1 mechanosensitive ion channel family protein [Alicyclobacillus mali (ex Roth et al. 2021)]